MNRHPSFGIVAVLLVALGPSWPVAAEQPRKATAEAQLDADAEVDLDEVMEMAQEQVEAAREQLAEATAEQVQNWSKDAEQARKLASEQMEKARKQLEEARRQWQKQLEESRKQMRVAANSIRAIARRERLTSALSRVGIVAARPDANGSPAVAAVQAVTPGSPAEKAGIKAGDVILSVNGQRLQPAPDGGTYDEGTKWITKQIQRSRPGRSIEVEYRRGKEVRKTSIEPESRSRWSFWMNDDGHGFASVQLPGGWHSLELAEINPALGEYFGTSRGLLVLRAPASSDVKLQAGDVILKIGDEEPSTPRQAVRLLRSYEPGKSIPVEIVRQKKKQTLALQLPGNAAKR